ncbi:MAG: hypothetical protein ABI833_23075 [Acidobacteriota bacterium]
MQSKLAKGFTLALALCANSAFGQYGGSGTGSYHASTGIAIGAAAAGAGIAYLAVHNHNHGKVVGCLQSSNAATTLRSDDKKHTYTLINRSSMSLKPGERVALKGKKIRQGSGLAFEVHGIAKDYGGCEL